MVSQSFVRPTFKMWFLKTIQVTTKRDPFDAMLGIHVDFTSILHSHTPLVPQVLCEMNLDRLRLFRHFRQ